MTRKSITTSHAAVSCDVCGRTLLRGENSDVFLAGGSRRTVCELCVPRATHEGWIREGLETSAPRRPSDRRGRSLLGRLGKRRREEHRPDRGSGDLRPGGADELLDRALSAAPQREPAQPQQQAEPRRPRAVHAVPTNTDLKRARALELFNASEHPRKVAGISRSLGEPMVVVSLSPTEGSVLWIVVGWELSWYRYEVDLADEKSGVRRVDQGTDLEQLADAERRPNAAAREDGSLVLASAG